MDGRQKDLTRDNSNITKTQRVLDHLKRERENRQLIGDQGSIILARKLLPTERIDDNTYSPEEIFISYLTNLDEEVQNIMFLEEVFKSHIKNMHESFKHNNEK